MGVGADQGQGAWRSWVKIPTMSGAEIRNRMANDVNYEPKNCYIIAQVAHIVCKKDHHEILSATVSDDLSAAYETLQASSLVFVKEVGEKRVKSYYIPRNAYNVCIEQDLLTYNLHADERDGFVMKYKHDEKLKEGSAIIIIIPHFDLYVTGDLTYYTDGLGMPKSSSYWCPWCLLSRVEWQQSAENNGEKRTIEFLQQTYNAVRNDVQKRMQPTEKKGVSCAMHYKSLGPDNFVPPLLHMEMGLVNQVWEDFENWVDGSVEIVPVDEKAARKAVLDAKERLDRAADERDTAKKTISVEIRQKNAEVKSLKCELQRRGVAVEIWQELNARIALLTASIKEQQSTKKNISESFKDAQEAYKQCKKKTGGIKDSQR